MSSLRRGLRSPLAWVFFVGELFGIACMTIAIVITEHV